MALEQLYWWRWFMSLYGLTEPHVRKELPPQRRRRIRNVQEYLKGWLIILLLAGLMVLTLSGCASRANGLIYSEPVFEYGWSPEYETMIENEKTMVRCLTTEDKRRLDIYLEMIKQFSNGGIK